MKCPICQKPVDLKDPAAYPDAPFCSARCRELDLGNWAMEKYVVSTPVQSNPEYEPDEEE